MAKGLLDLVKTDSLNNEDLLLVNQNTFDKSVSVQTIVEKVEEVTDSKYVALSGATMTGPLIITKVDPDMTGIVGEISSTEIGSSNKKINAVYSNIFYGTSVLVEDIRSTEVTTDRLNLISEVSFNSNKALLQYNSSDSSIDFIIN